MNRWLPRTVATLVLRRCLATAGPVAAAAGALCWALQRAQVTDAVDAEATANAAPWLLLPLLATATVVTFATVWFWPPFARGRPGADWLRLHTRGGLQGCGAAIAGALLAQVLLAAPLVWLLAPQLGAPGSARTHRALPQPNEPHLGDGSAPLRLSLPAGAWSELWIRPLAGPPRGPLAPTVVQVLVDGGTVDRPEFAGPRVLATVPLPPATGSVELVYGGGNVPLFLGEQSLVVVSDGQMPTTANGLLLAVLSLLPTFVALALACLAAIAASRSTVSLVLGSTLLLLTVGEVGPLAAAGRALLRGQWLWPIFTACWPGLVVGSLAMCAARLLRLRPWRAE